MLTKQERKQHIAISSQLNMLMLGLFLILLAFFILLNAIATLKEERATQVAQGLEQGFGAAYGVLLPTSQAQTLVQQHQRVLQSIITLFDNDLPNGVQVRGVRSLSSFLFIQLEDFFTPFSDEVLPIRTSFFKNLATHLQSHQEGVYITLEVQIPAFSITDNALELAAMRAAAFAQKLTNVGVAARVLTPKIIANPKYVGQHVLQHKDALIRLQIETKILP